MRVEGGDRFVTSDQKVDGWQLPVALLKKILKLRRQPHAADASLLQDLRDVVAFFKWCEEWGDATGGAAQRRNAEFERSLGHAWSKRAASIVGTIQKARANHLQADIELLGGDTTDSTAEARLKPATLSCLQMCARAPLPIPTFPAPRSVTMRCALQGGEAPEADDGVRHAGGAHGAQRPDGLLARPHRRGRRPGPADRAALRRQHRLRLQGAHPSPRAAHAPSSYSLAQIVNVGFVKWYACVPLRIWGKLRGR